jgi:predicted GIY-YIG superfamily endonuclease
MPKKEVDYSKTVIYKIVCNDLSITALYVGSTTQFTKRKSQHKTVCNSSYKQSEFKVYKIIRDNGGWDNWAMIQIEEYPCLNGNEARARERYWYEQLNATLNAQKPTLTEEEIKTYHTIVYQKQLEIHPDFHQKKFQRALEMHTDFCQKRYQRQLELHPDTAKKNYQRRLLLHPGLKEQKKYDRHICECGSDIRRADKSTHQKSLKHQNYIKSLESAIDA